MAILVRCQKCGRVGDDERPHRMTDANVDQIIANSGYQFVCGACQAINMLDQCLEREASDGDKLVSNRDATRER